MACRRRWRSETFYISPHFFAIFFTFIHIFLTTKLVFNLIYPGEESCGNSTEIFTTETPSSLCNEVMMDVGGLSSLSTKITIFQIKVFTYYAGGFSSLSNKILFFLDQRIYSIFSGWKQLLHLCNKRGLGKGGRRGGNQFPVV